MATKTEKTSPENKEKDEEDKENHEYFRSRRIKKGDIRKPWLMAPPDSRDKWITIMPFTGAFLGLCIAGVLIWDGWQSVHSHQYCKMFEDTFEEGINTEIWSPEITTGGFGSVISPILDCLGGPPFSLSITHGEYFCPRR